MLAYVMHDIDNAGLVDLANPRPGPGEVLVRARTSSLNPHDAHVLHGFARAYLEYELPAVLGTDIAGVVEDVGPGVTRAAAGDRVFGLERSTRVHNGTFAEYVVLPETSLARTPGNIDDASAGALGLAAVMAFTAVDAMQPAECSVLINGATGGVGCFVTQLAAAQGARVIATARPGAEAALLGRLGAQTTIDWSNQDVGDVVADAGGVDVLLDLVNHDPEALERLAARALISDGRAFTTLVPQSSNAHFLAAASSPELLDRIAAAASTAQLTVTVERTYPIAEINDAFVALSNGTLGKIGLTLS